MKQRYIKIAVTAIVLMLAFSGLLWSTLQEGAEYYKYVDEVMAAPHEWEGKTLQVHGNVVPGSIRGTSDRLNWKFELHRNGKVIAATYSGLTPDTFKDEAEVVLTGRFTAEGFHATDMTAKCPSKYEEAPPVGPAATTSS